MYRWRARVRFRCYLLLNGFECLRQLHMLLVVFIFQVLQTVIVTDYRTLPNYPVSPAYHHVSATHWPPLSSYYLPLFRVYIDALELQFTIKLLVQFHTHCKAYSYDPGSHYLLNNQPGRTTCCTIQSIYYLITSSTFAVY